MTLRACFVTLIVPAACCTWLTVTLHAADVPLLVTVALKLPADANWVEKVAAVPLVGLPLGADQLNAPLPPLAVNEAVCPTFTV